MYEERQLRRINSSAFTLSLQSCLAVVGGCILQYLLTLVTYKSVNAK